MSRQARRTFLRQTGTAMVGTAVVALGRSSRALGANQRVVVGILGCGGQGNNLGRTFAAQPDVKLAYACDPDSSRAASARKAFQADQAVADLRRVLDDKGVDAVVIATPDHWHAPAAILACQAGKHVYVEKCCSHNIREGRLLIEAARTNRRVMQVGTQSRSNAGIQKGIEMLRQGAIGEVLVAKAWNSQRRANIGHQKPADPPPGFDYDLYVGPAPWIPYQPNRCHYGWHWCYNFGTGDAGNDGVHDIDIALWGLGVEGHPRLAAGYGSKLFFDDDQQFPDTQYVVFEYPGDGRIGTKRTLIYEQRIWSPYVQEDAENGNAFYGTKGMMLLCKKTGWKLFGERNLLIAEEHYRLELAPHVRDFLEAIKTGRRPNADIEIAHRAGTLSHLANIVARVGRQVHFDPETEQILGDQQANRLVRREYREGHWAVPQGA
ncbi:MAG: Gfo/Idh/MocA family oxidoreductase [Thermoguttaceae bacterium]